MQTTTYCQCLCDTYFNGPVNHLWDLYLRLKVSVTKFSEGLLQLNSAGKVF